MCGCTGSSSTASSSTASSSTASSSTAGRLFGVFVEDVPAAEGEEATTRVNWDRVFVVLGLVISIIALLRRR